MVIRAALFAVAVALAGCSNAPVRQVENDPQPAPQWQLDEVKNEVANLDRAVNSLMTNPTLKLSDTGFNTIDSTLGTVTIQWTKSAKAGAGTRVSFRIGNPTTATLKGLTLSSTQHGKEGLLKDGQLVISLSGEVPAGSWATVQGVFDKLPPEQISEIHAFSLQSETVSLKTP